VTAAGEEGHAGRRSPVRSALRRIWNAGAWLPVLADRRGFRWLLSGRLVGAPIVILTHRGRRSGRLYRTPVEAIVEDDASGEVVVSPMRGRRGDWFRNIVTGGLVEMTLRGERFRPAWRELSEAENREALERYRAEHPIYGRFVLWTLARLHGLHGETLPAVAGAIPMLALKRPAGGPTT
jgi:deazaflavin-dependent oxidoreductase (nitroreductase family)